MAHFIGRIQGQRGAVSRLGGKTSGLRAGVAQDYGVDAADLQPLVQAFKDLNLKY